MALESQTNQKSDIWNIAKGYVTLKVLKILVENDTIVNIAIYGYENIEESTGYTEEIITAKRIEAIRRLHTNLEKLYSNSEFTILKKELQEFQQYKDTLKVVYEALGKITKETIDQRTNIKKITIDEEHFKKCLDEMREIMREMNKQLNNANLIFPSSEETDIEKMKEELIEGG
jgi:DNA-binding protein YbaB